jgi:ankyrin repeat protein
MRSPVSDFSLNYNQIFTDKELTNMNRLHHSIATLTFASTIAFVGCGRNQSQNQSSLMAGDEKSAEKQVYEAAKNGETETLKNLLKANPSLAKSTKDYTGPLAFAARDGRLETVKFLVEELKVSVDEKDPLDLTPLHYATAGRKTEIIKYLASKKCDLNAQSPDGPALINAAAHPSLELTKLLVDLGADVNVVNKKRGTVLDFVNSEIESGKKAQSEFDEKSKGFASWRSKLNDLESIKSFLISKSGKTQSDLEKDKK